MEETKVKQVNENIAEQETNEEPGMEELLGQEIKLEEGKLMAVKVVAETEDGFLVDIGLKSEGIIPKSEIDSPAIRKEIVVGSTIPVIMVQMHSDLGHPIVSYKKVREQAALERLSEGFKTGNQIDGTIISKVKGGFIVDVGINAFLPVSQLELRPPKEIDTYIGKSFKFIITEFNRQLKNLVVSRRKILEGVQNELKAKTLSSLTTGQLIEGKVTNTTDFGAFVDIGGVEGLIHISDISWQHTKKVTDFIKIGDQVKVQVLKIDREKGKISLGMKQLVERPWLKVKEKFPVGSIVKGKVSSITDFGVFVELEPGIEGLMHGSEISWTVKSPKLKDLYKPGQSVELKVIAIDAEEEKLSLSLKKMGVNPWEEVAKQFPAGTKIKGIVSHLTPFGAFIKLSGGIEGLIHVSDMSWTKKIRHPQDMLKENEEVECIVREINLKDEKIALSIKHLTEDPYKKYAPGAVVSGTVKRIVDFGAFVEIDPGIEALVRLSEISPTKIAHPSEALTVGQAVEAKIIKGDGGDRKIDISIRKLDHEREREMLKKYVNKGDRPTLGDILQDDEE